jgi:hypothetical protein
MTGESRTVAKHLYKAASLVSVRQMLQRADLEQRFLSELSELEEAEYRRLTATDWVHVALADRVYAAAAPLLFPAQREPVRLLGRELARDHLRGIYRFVIRFVTVPFVVAQTGRLWRMYNSEGALSMQEVGDRKLSAVLTGYPEYPSAVRQSLAGYIVGAIELTGAKDVRVTVDDQDPKAYCFTATWR